MVESRLGWRPRLEFQEGSWNLRSHDRALVPGEPGENQVRSGPTPSTLAHQDGDALS